MTQIELVKRYISIGNAEISKSKSELNVRSIEADLIKWHKLLAKLDGTNKRKLSKLDNSILANLEHLVATAIKHQK
jgi:hypothetical protein